jgi:hypothetical protein
MNFYAFYGSKTTKTTLLFINLTGIRLKHIVFNGFICCVVGENAIQRQNNSVFQADSTIYQANSTQN